MHDAATTLRFWSKTTSSRHCTARITSEWTKRRWVLALFCVGEHLHGNNHSHDYLTPSTIQAIKDFHQRVKTYEEVYETITNRSVHYIKV